MRNWSFTLNNDKEYNEAANQLEEMFTNTKDYKDKKIIIGKMENGDQRKIYLSIEDGVAGAFTITTMNAFDKGLKNVFTTTKSDCKDIRVEFPVNCTINSWYEEDVVCKREKKNEGNITDITKRS